ncbi:hypothetical protein BAE44_0018799, partial [Dichanthelium oligosanthes]
LIRLWIADGLVKSSGRERVEMEAIRRFDELLWRSFFETSNTFPTRKFRVLGLMLQLAQLVSKHESLTLGPNNSFLPDRPDGIRYVTILCPKDEPLAFDNIYHYKNSRFYWGLYTPQIPQPSEYSDKDSSRNSLQPIQFAKTLDLRGCFWLMDLPGGMSRLVNMRHLCLHLDWDRVTAFRSMASGIDKLQSLQTLSRFVVVSRYGGKCNINELKNLKIHGELCILNLEAATDDGSKEANLSVKEYLHKLMLKWSHDTYKDAQQLDIEKSLDHCWGSFITVNQSSIRATRTLDDPAAVDRISSSYTRNPEKGWNS